MAEPRIENVVFCDGIRFEIGGKHTLVGAFAPELNIQSIPSTIAIAIWMSIIPVEAGDLEAELKLKEPNGNENIILRMKASISIIAKTAIAIPQMPINILSTGIYKFYIRFGNSKWRSIGEIKMNLPPDSAPITSG
jgi:hypothetical protein